MRASLGIDPSANMNRNHKSSRQLRVAASAAIYGNSLFLVEVDRHRSSPKPAIIGNILCDDTNYVIAIIGIPFNLLALRTDGPLEGNIW
jgi:hypothetical protein